MSGGGGDVESALSDFATRLRWVRGWQSVFFSLYCAVMAVSLVLYLCLIRAVARYVQCMFARMYGGGVIVNRTVVCC